MMAAQGRANRPALGKVRFDYTNLLADAVGAENGVTDQELRGISQRAADAAGQLQQMRTRGQVEWMDLPYQRDIADAVVTFAASVAARCDAFVVLGIGGSALGAIALQTALRQSFYNQLSPAERGN